MRIGGLTIESDGEGRCGDGRMAVDAGREEAWGGKVRIYWCPIKLFCII